MQPILKDNLAEVILILKAHHVKRAFAFGSVCTDQFNENSDIDFLISFEDHLDPIQYGESYFNLMYSLQDLLKREVDLVTERTLKNPFFIKVLNKTKTPLYE